MSEGLMSEGLMSEGLMSEGLRSELLGGSSPGKLRGKGSTPIKVDLAFASNVRFLDDHELYLDNVELYRERITTYTLFE